MYTKGFGPVSLSMKQEEEEIVIMITKEDTYHVFNRTVLSMLGKFPPTELLS